MTPAETEIVDPASVPMITIPLAAYRGIVQEAMRPRYAMSIPLPGWPSQEIHVRYGLQVLGLPQPESASATTYLLPQEKEHPILDRIGYGGALAVLAIGLVIAWKLLTKG